VRPCYAAAYYNPQSKTVPLCEWEYEDEAGEVQTGPTIEHRTDICETQCLYDEALKPDDIEPMTYRLIQLRAQIDGGRPFDADELTHDTWELLGFIKNIQESWRMESLMRAMWG